MPQCDPLVVVLRALVLVVLSGALLQLPARADAWKVERDRDLDLDHDLDHDHDHDFDLDDDLDDIEEDEHGIRRIRLPKNLDDGKWDEDFEKMMRTDTPWGRGGEGYDDFVKRFSTEHHEDLDTPDDWE